MRPILFFALLLLVPPLAGGEPDAAVLATRRAIAWLGETVPRLPDMDGTPRKPFTYAFTGLVYLMEPGSRTGPDRIRPIRAYLTQWIDRLGERLKDPQVLPVGYGVADSRCVCQYTWPLAAAGLFFGELEVRGMDARQAHATVEKILDLLVDAQDGNGGWGHGRIRDPSSAPGGYPSTLLASSNCVATALGLLATIEGHDRPEAIKRARAYYRAARLPNGSFPYDPSQRQSGFSETNAGRTAGALFAWHALGMERDDAFSGSARYLLDHLAWVPEGHGSPCLNMVMGALACRMLGKEEWAKYKALAFPRIVAAQDGNGVLKCICEKRAFGVTCDSEDLFRGMGGFTGFADTQAAFTTALHAFVLLLDRGDLRILDRRKPGGPITPKRR
jgi:hypothetical protein